LWTNSIEILFVNAAVALAGGRLLYRNGHDAGKGNQSDGK